MKAYLGSLPQKLLSIFLFLNMLVRLIILSFFGVMAVFSTAIFDIRVIVIFIILLMIFMVSRWLYLVFSNIENKKPFSRENGEMFIKSSYCMVVAGVFSLISDMLMIPAESLNNEVVTYNPSGISGFDHLFYALILYTIGRIFISGAKLKEEQDLTV